MTQLNQLYRIDTKHKTQKMRRYVSARLSLVDIDYTIIIPRGYNTELNGIKYQTEVLIVVTDYITSSTSEDELLAFEIAMTDTCGWDIIASHGTIRTKGE